MDEDAVIKELCEFEICEDIENSDDSNDSMVLLHESSGSNKYSIMERNLEKKNEEALETIHEKCYSSSLQTKDSVDKSDTLEDKGNAPEKDLASDSYFRLKVIDYVNALEKIIQEDEKRYELFEPPSEPSIYKYEKHSLSMSTESFIKTLDKLNDYIVKKMNKYYEALREMDSRIINLNTEKSNLKDIIVEKELLIKNASKNKNEITVDSIEKYQSLRDFERVNKRNLCELSQLKEELKIRESEIDEFHRMNRTLKKELRKKTSECDEIQCNYNDLIEEKDKLERENKKLKKSQKNRSVDSSDLEEKISKYKGKIGKLNEKLDSKSQEIETMKAEMNEKNEKLNSLEMSVSNMKGPIRNQGVESEIEELKAKLQIMADHMKEKEEEADAKEAEHRNISKKKEDALKKIRQKYDDTLSEKKDYMEKSDSLQEKVTKLEEDLARKSGAIDIMKDKIKSLGAMEKESKNLKQLQMAYAAKEQENKALAKARGEMSQKFEEKAKEVELIRKEKIGLDKEIQNMKLLNFKTKDTQK